MKCNLVLLVFTLAEAAAFFIVPTSLMSKTSPGQMNTILYSNEDDMASVDAKVLRSLLQEQPELASDDRYQELLERTEAAAKREASAQYYRKPIENETEEQAPKKEEKQYASDFFQSITNWGSFQAKAQELFESAALFVQNRIEQDLKLSLSLGLFALDRAVKDSGRALNAAQDRVAVGLPQLGTNSSYVEQKPKLLGMTNSQSIRQEFNSPVDEIKSVSDSIIGILSGEDVEKVVNRPIKGQRALSKIAPGGASKNAERQKRAFQARKETVLKREKEGIDAKIGRAASSLSETAWQMKNEMDVEENKPGYRSKALRSAISETASATAAIGGKILENYLKPAEDTSSSKTLLPDTRSLRTANVLDGIAENTPAAPDKEDVATETREISFDNASQPIDEDGTYFASSIETPKINQYVDAMLEERARVVAALKNCLEFPERTWMADTLVTEEELDDESLNRAITEMILSKKEFSSELDVSSMTFSDEDVKREIKRIDDRVDQIVVLVGAAAGIDASDKIKTELLHNRVLKVYDIITEDPIRAPRNTYYANGSNFSVSIGNKENDSDYSPSSNSNKSRVSTVHKEATARDIMKTTDFDRKLEPQAGETKKPFANIIDVELETPIEIKSFGDTNNTREMAVDDDSIATYEVEILTDEDDDKFNQSASSTRRAQSVSDEEFKAEGERTQEDDSVVTKIALRSLDILFFAFEKVILGLPGIAASTLNLISRIQKIQREGRGEKGWKQLENVQKGSRRY